MSLVQSVKANFGGGSNVTPSLTGVTGSNSLLFFAQGAHITDAVPTDSTGQTWTKLHFDSFFGTQWCSVCCYYLLNANSGTHNITWTGSVADWGSYELLEWTTLSAVDVTGTASHVNGTVSGLTPSSITTTFATDAVFAYMASGYNGASNMGISDPPSGFTSIYANQDSTVSAPCEICYKETTTTGSQSTSWSWTSISTDAIGIIVSFKKGAAGPPALTSVTSTAGIGSINLGVGVSKALTSLTSTASLSNVGPNVTLALSGVSSTTSVGTMTPSGGGSPVLSFVTATGSAGTVGPGAALALSGNSATASVSNVGAGVAPTLSAVSSASAVGTVMASAAAPIAGTVATGSAGNAAPSVASALSAVSSSTSVSTTGVNVSVALTGVSSTCTVGTVRAPGLQLGPVQATGSVGTLSLGVAAPLSAVSSTSTPGTVRSTPQLAITAVSAGGSVGNVVFGNVVVGLTGVSSGSIVGNVAPPRAPDQRNGELFMAQQSALPPYYTGPLPTPNNRGAIFYASGTWTVPLGATNVFVSATAGGGTPLGNAGDQLLHGQLPVSPGDVLSVTMDAGGNVYVAKGSTLLLSLFAGDAYGKIAWQATWGQQSGLPGDFGSGVDAGTPFPPILVFYWN